MDIQQQCNCGSGKPLAQCCLPIIEGQTPARTPEELMRARFTAHAIKNYPFLVESVHPDHREGVSVEELNEWSAKIDWEELEVHSATPGETEDQGEVSFSAYYSINGTPQELREDAAFARENGRWYYVDGHVHGREPYVREQPRIGRNEPCPCASGKKYKKCCGM